jgi:hypothetical protein
MYKISLGSIFLCCLWLTGCAGSQPKHASLTLAKDQTQASGSIVRQDENSITLMESDGHVQTFLLSDLSSLRYGEPAVGTDTAPVAVATPPLLPVSKSEVSLVQIPAGTDIFVRTSRFIDSCCAPISSLQTGVIDSDVRDARGKLLIPQGANVIFIVRDQEIAGGQLTMQFELGSADFRNRHFVTASSGDDGKSGAFALVTGSKDSGRKEGSLHIEENSAVKFHTKKPFVMKSVG